MHSSLGTFALAFTLTYIPHTQLESFFLLLFRNATRFLFLFSFSFVHTFAASPLDESAWDYFFLLL